MPRYGVLLVVGSSGIFWGCGGPGSASDPNDAGGDTGNGEQLCSIVNSAAISGQTDSPFFNMPSIAVTDDGTVSIAAWVHGDGAPDGAPSAFTVVDLSADLIELERLDSVTVDDRAFGDRMWLYGVVAPTEDGWIGASLDDRDEEGGVRVSRASNGSLSAEFLATDFGGLAATAGGGHPISASISADGEGGAVLAFVDFSVDEEDQEESWILSVDSGLVSASTGFYAEGRPMIGNEGYLLSARESVFLVADNSGGVGAADYSITAYSQSGTKIWRQEFPNGPGGGPKVANLDDGLLVLWAEPSDVFGDPVTESEADRYHRLHLSVLDPTSGEMITDEVLEPQCEDTSKLDQWEEGDGCASRSGWFAAATGPDGRTAIITGDGLWIRATDGEIKRHPEIKGAVGGVAYTLSGDLLQVRGVSGIGGEDWEADELTVESIYCP